VTSEDVVTSEQRLHSEKLRLSTTVTSVLFLYFPIFLMSSRPLPKKKGVFKHSASNPLSNFTSFSSLGLSFHQPEDNLIRNRTVSRDGCRIHTEVVVAPPQSPVKPGREHTDVQPSLDWDNWEDIDDVDMDNKAVPAELQSTDPKDGRGPIPEMVSLPIFTWSLLLTKKCMLRIHQCEIS
jgi:hypothetical protein